MPCYSTITNANAHTYLPCRWDNELKAKHENHTVKATANEITRIFGEKQKKKFCKNTKTEIENFRDTKKVE